MIKLSFRLCFRCFSLFVLGLYFLVGGVIPLVSSLAFLKVSGFVICGCTVLIFALHGFQWMNELGCARLCSSVVKVPLSL